ncbi:MAG: BTAD domain-containing putative transcriptional regulator [Acidimicrobiia bacterium]
MGAPRSQLHLALLGPPEIKVDGEPLEVDTRKAVAMIAYLAVSGDQPTREQVATLLWPDLDPERARATLRRTLSALRTGLSGRWLRADRLRIWLNGDSRITDIERVAELIGQDHGHGPDKLCPKCATNLAEAAALFRGPFMAGFFLRDSSEYEDWQRREEERQQRILREVLERLGLALAAGGRFDEAASAARRRLDLDDLDEAAHRQLMQFLVWNGDRTGALRQFRECAAVLDRDLGVPPLPETRALYEQILAGEEAPAPAGRVTIAPIAAPSAPASPKASGFVGRMTELSSLTRSGHRLVTVTGEEGIGKTRLIDEWMSRMGAVSARSAASPGASSVPYLAIRDALASAIANGRMEPPPAAAAEAVRLLPELASVGFGSPGPAGDQRAGARFHAGVTAALAHLIPNGILVIDDAQWLDESSIAMIVYMLTHQTAGAPRLVLALREEEMDPSHPLLIVGRRMERTGEALRLPLGPLPPSEARLLLEHEGYHAIDQGLAERILEAAAGNPLFVLAYRDAIGSDREDLPPDLEEVVAARIGHLDDISQQVLAAASVLGAESDVEVLRVVAGRSEEEVVTSIEALVQRRLLDEVGGGVRFSHEVIRRAVYRSLSAARRRLLHSRAAGVVRHQPANLAHHLELAGRSNEAAIAHAQAGEAALRLFAYPEARDHLEAALALGHLDRASVNLRLGDSYLRMGDYRSALAAYEAVDSPGTSAEVEHRIGEVYRRLGRYELAEASYAAAAESSGDDALASQIAANRALVAHQQGNTTRSRKFAATALQRAEQAGDGATLAQAWNLAGMLSPDAKRAVREFEKALAKADEIGRPDLAAAALNNLAIARRRVGDSQGGVDAARRALALLEPVGDRHQLAALHSNLADALHEIGEEQEARIHLTKSAALFAEVGVEDGEWEPEIWKLSEW